ncbi:MAG: L,D-transpeptidase [Deltaproteobacteria bacterium]|nr:L,D-transpeptidase [Deltaproteobacteria bacterium]
MPPDPDLVTAQEDEGNAVPPPTIELEPSPYDELDLPASLRVDENRLVVRRGPSRKNKRRGVVMKGSRLPVYEAVEGPGCNQPWYRIHDEAWVCGSKVEVSDDDPYGQRYPIVPEGELTPWPYAFVRQAALEYRYGGGGLSEVREVFKGYGFGVKGYTKVGGQTYFRTVEGRLVPRNAAGITHRISDFEGVVLDGDQSLPLGFVNSKKAWTYSEPKLGKKYRLESIERYAMFSVLEHKGKGRRGFVRIDEGLWLRRTDVRIAETAPLPKSYEPGERWVDVNIAEQTITAYQGETPVYVTLTSTGRWGGSRTRKGEFRVWVKISAIPMDNTDEELEEDEEEDEELDLDAGVEDDRHLYSLHDVPWTQFFFESYALHGVYWHNRFGNRRSHGCVNLSPIDARWFFDWTRPFVPDGWWAIYTAKGERGTLVRVR